MDRQRSSADDTHRPREAAQTFSTLDEIIDPELLSMLSQASGFTFRPDPTLPPHESGYTRPDTMTIYYNPARIKGDPERGIAPWSRSEALGFLFHEAGHHAPPVKELEAKLRADLGNTDIIPERFRGNGHKESLFFQALWKHMHNPILDIWLERYMGRRTHAFIQEKFVDLYASMPIFDLRKLSKPEQLVQMLVRAPYMVIPGDVSDPDVDAAFRRLVDKRALHAITDVSAFENYFASDEKRRRLIEKKFAAYRDVLLPEYLKLLDAEGEKRQQEGRGDGGEKGEEGSGDALEKLLKELIEQGHADATAPEPGEQDLLNELFRQKDAPGVDGPEPKGPEPEDDPLEALRRVHRRLQREERTRERNDLAQKNGVSPETIRVWQRIRERYAKEIEYLVAAFKEIFEADRKLYKKYQRREGEITPGLEYETIGAHLGGDLDPSTKMIDVRNTEFLETEVEFVVDVSGSMSGEPLDESRDLLVILSESFRQTRELLADQELLEDEAEQPLRIGVTTFADDPERLTRLDEPVSDRKQMKIIQGLLKTRGATDETDALNEAIKGLRLGKPNVLKFIVVLSDGAGNKDGVAPIMQQLERDDEVVLLAAGLGATATAANDVVDTYLGPLKKRKGGNVFGATFTSAKDVLPYVVDFLKTQVHERRDRFR